MPPLTFLSIQEITTAIRSKQFAASDILEAHLTQIARVNPHLNAFTHLDEETARAEARRLDEQPASATPSATAPFRPLHGILHGIPLTIKSCIDVASWPCPAGSLLRKNHVPQEDAPLVSRLKRAGAILLGNTNTPEFLMHYESANSLGVHASAPPNTPHNRTANPWNPSYSAGGSSGGEAAAISSGCSVAGIGSDGGGSIRVPAHFCGICGLKPTPGRVPGTGHFPPSASAFPWLGVVGPMARSIADLQTLFQVLADPHERDAPTPVAPNELLSTKIGVLASDALGSPTPETHDALQKAANLLANAGFRTQSIRIPELARALELWWSFFGPAVAQLFTSSFTTHDAQLLSPQFREYLAAAQSDPPPTPETILAAASERDHLRAQILRRLETVPLLLSHVSTAPAFAHGQGSWLGPQSYRQTMRASQWLNLTGFPALTLPMHFSQEKLPIGVQLIARPNEEKLLLAVAASLEQHRGPFPHPHL
jgi:Asp-tRNA(Asn)/Glu-tRNA(Gln) amidotransferase A subunit family amidase